MLDSDASGPSGPSEPSEQPSEQPSSGAAGQRSLGERRRRRVAERAGQVDLDATMSHWPVSEPPTSPRPVLRPARPTLEGVATGPVLPTPSAMVVGPLLEARSAAAPRVRAAGGRRSRRVDASDPDPAAGPAVQLSAPAPGGAASVSAPRGPDVGGAPSAARPAGTAAEPSGAPGPTERNAAGEQTTEASGATPPPRPALAAPQQPRALLDVARRRVRPGLEAFARRNRLATLVGALLVALLVVVLVVVLLVVRSGDDPAQAVVPVSDVPAQQTLVVTLVDPVAGGLVGGALLGVDASALATLLLPADLLLTVADAGDRSLSEAAVLGGEQVRRGLEDTLALRVDGVVRWSRRSSPPWWTPSAESWSTSRARSSPTTSRSRWATTSGSRAPPAVAYASLQGPASRSRPGWPGSARCCRRWWPPCRPTPTQPPRSWSRRVPPRPPGWAPPELARVVWRLRPTALPPATPGGRAAHLDARRRGGYRCGASTTEAAQPASSTAASPGRCCRSRPSARCGSWSATASGRPGLAAAARDLLVASGLRFVGGGNVGQFGEQPRTAVLVASQDARRTAPGARPSRPRWAWGPTPSRSTARPSWTPTSSSSSGRTSPARSSSRAQAHARAPSPPPPPPERPHDRQHARRRARHRRRRGRRREARHRRRRPRRQRPARHHRRLRRRLRPQRPAGPGHRGRRGGPVARARREARPARGREGRPMGAAGLRRDRRPRPAQPGA